jgi:hypothetical protein
VNQRQPHVARERFGEEADGYGAVVAQLNDNWRVIVCRSGIQWILQRRGGERHGRARWEGRSYCRTNEAIKRLSRRFAGAMEPAAAATLAALPERIDAEPIGAAAKACDELGEAVA